VVGSADSTPFVGRADELRRLDALGAAAMAGQGGLAVVSGEAGIGKTRLCGEVARRAFGSGLRVVTARCWADGGAPALWPWQPILSELCGDGAAGLLDPDGGAPGVDPDRFARFRAVTDRLAAACGRAPVCLVVDDLHAADAGTLLLVRFVTRSLDRLPLALVVTRRTGEPMPGSAEAGLLDEVEREAMPVVLRRFDLAETAAFLSGHAGSSGRVDPDLSLTLQRVTGGNPLFLRRVAALGVADRRERLPAGVHLAIEEALVRLSPTAQWVLRVASVLGSAPAVTEAAAVAGTDAATVLDAAAEARKAGLVAAPPGSPHPPGSEGTPGSDGPPGSPGSGGPFAFSHELIRSGLEGSLPAGDRLDAHARAAQVVAGERPDVPTDRLARRAHHALAAAPRSPVDARRAVSACRAAARSMVRSFAYERADGLLSAAVDLAEAPDVGPPSGRLLVEWAQAALLCGRLGEARVRFDRAATVAQREGDTLSLAEAALGLGGHWVNEHRAPVERARVLGLQRAALARLPGAGGAEAGGGVAAIVDALRYRLVARLAAEEVYAGGPVVPVHEALAASRRCPDPAARAEVLSLCHHALLTPEHTRLRLELADELVRVASEAGHGVLALMGLCWRAVDLFLMGDPGAERALEDLRERADALACQNILYIVDVLDVMLLVRRGRLAEAEAAAARCHDRGTAVGEVDTFGYLGAHTLAIRWIQGRDGELVEAAEQVAASPTLVQAEFAFRATAAALAARAGFRDRARAALDRLAAGGLAALPQSSTWLPGMLAIAEAAAELGDRAIAREVYDLLLPHRDLPAMPSLAVVCLGSSERPLGLAARTLGDVDLAVDHLDRAVAADRRLGNRPLAAITLAELAGALRERDRPGDRDRAAEALDEAIATAEALDMAVRADAWRDDRDRARRGSHGSERDAGRPGLIRREGRSWRVAVEGREALVPDRIGMTYLAELLTRPGRAVPAVELAGGPGAGAAAAAAGVQGPRQDVLDADARAAYATRARALTTELAAAEDRDDTARAERLRSEIGALADEVEAATGLGGRPRRFADGAERARTAVRKALKRAIDEIDAAEPTIGAALHATVTTGTTCAYTPDPHAPIRWSRA
jgi:tetratricopeptide (TPR) repeat protein